MRWFGIPARIAGRKAARSWQRILDHTGEDIEDLTGKDLYNHARSEAEKYIKSSPDGWRIHNPEKERHEEFLLYVESFLTAFPSRHGYPKEQLVWGKDIKPGENKAYQDARSEYQQILQEIVRSA